MIMEYSAESLKKESVRDKNFRNIGIFSFFNTEEDSKVDWEEVLGIKIKQVK